MAKVQNFIQAYNTAFTEYLRIKFRNENELMEKAEDPEDYYIHVIMQEKIKLYLEIPKGAWHTVEVIEPSVIFTICNSSSEIH